MQPALPDGYQLSSLPALSQDAVHYYGKAMFEIKDIVMSIDRVIANEGLFHPIISGEFCALQLRMICEVLALGCLVLHGDIEPASDIERYYEPKRIFDGLDRLKSDSFPSPYVLTANGHVPLTVGYMKKTDISGLWGRLGNYLHKGSLGQFKKRPDASQGLSLDWVIENRSKIISLINVHIVKVANCGTSLHIIMGAPGTEVIVDILHRVERTTT